MVAQHYRWDFIGLSTDVKPTPETSERVVDGSTFYCSDNSKLYVYCKDNWYERKALGSGGGGGTSYTAGTGIDITDDTISVDTDTIQEKLTAGSNITISDNVISASGGGTSYTAGTGIDITSDTISVDTDTIQGKLTAGTGIDITSDTISVDTDTIQGKLTAGTNITISDNVISASGGGGGDTVYSTVTTSNGSDGGAVYIGPLNASQQELADPTTTDNHYRYFWALPFDPNGQDDFGKPKNETINIGGKQISGTGNVTLGYRTSVTGDNNTVLGRQAQSLGYASNVVVGHSAQSSGSSAVVLGRSANTTINGTVALGAYSQPTRTGEVNVGTSSSSYGYNSTNYRVIGGVHDGQDAHDAMTVGQANALIDAINTALSTNIPHIGA